MLDFKLNFKWIPQRQLEFLEALQYIDRIKAQFLSFHAAAAQKQLLQSSLSWPPSWPHFNQGSSLIQPYKAMTKPISVLCAKHGFSHTYFNSEDIVNMSKMRGTSIISEAMLQITDFKNQSMWSKTSQESFLWCCSHSLKIVMKQI